MDVFLQKHHHFSLQVKIPEGDSFRYFREEISLVSETNEAGEPVAWGEVDDTYNFWDPLASGEVTGVPGYEGVTWEEVYDSIDMVFSSTPLGPVLYFVCHPGSDPEAIFMQFEGQDSLHIDIDDDLRIFFGANSIELHEAIAYQVVSGVPTALPWDAAWDVNTSIVSFTFGSYDPTEDLILRIGPPPAPPAGSSNIEWSTYIASPGAFAGQVSDVVDASNGGIFVCGTSNPSYFLATAGLDPSPTPVASWGMISYFDAYHAKQWTGYLGPTLNGMALDEDNDRLYVVGSGNGAGVYTIDFNTGDVTDYFEDTDGNGYIAMVADPFTTTPTVPWASRFNGLWVSAVAVDAIGQVFITGISQMGLLDQVIPPSPGFVQGCAISAGNSYNAFVSRFDATAHLTWSTCIGGSHDDEAFDIAVDPNTDRVAVVGRTRSNNATAISCGLPLSGYFPMCDGGGYFQNLWNGNGAGDPVWSFDGFICLFSTTTAELLWSTYFGTPGENFISSCTFNAAGDLAIAGVTGAVAYNATSCSEPDATTPGFPNCWASGWWYQSAHGGYYDHFIARFNAATELVHSTFVGGIGEEGWAQDLLSLKDLPQVAFDDVGNLYFAGSTRTGSFPDAPGSVSSIPVNADFYYEDEHSDPMPLNGHPVTDAFVGRLTPGGQKDFTAYYGGFGEDNDNWTDYGMGERVCGLAAGMGRVYVVGATSSITDFPLHATGSAWFEDVPPSYALGSSNSFNGYVAQFSWLFTGVPEQIALAPIGLDVMPVPASEEVVVVLPKEVNGAVNVSVIDMSGRVVLSDRLRPVNRRIEIGIAHLASGQYTVLVQGPINGAVRIVRSH